MDLDVAKWIKEFDVRKWLEDNAASNMFWGSIGLIMANIVWPKYGKQIIKGYGPIIGNLHNLAIIGIGAFGLYLLEKDKKYVPQANAAIASLPSSYPMNDLRYNRLHKIIGHNYGMLRNKNAVIDEEEEGDI